MKKVSDLLAGKNKAIYSVSPHSTVFEALQMMVEREVGVLMVWEEEGKDLGIITERDYARKVVLKGKKSPETKVEEIMTPARVLFTVKPDTTVEECMILITGKRIRHLPVYEGNKFIGLVSIGDVLKSIISEQESLIEQLSNYIAGKF